MTISKITPYTGGVANPDGSQTQTEFTQNMFDQLSYEANLSTELNNTVDGINDTAIQVDSDAVSASQSAAAAEAAVSGLDYQGLWPDTGGSANKGETWQTQNGGTPTGLYFTALQSTTAYPVSDDVNWREVVSIVTLPNYTYIVYKASGGNSAVENMIAGIPISAKVGDKCSTGGTSWRRVANSGDISDFIALNGVWVADFTVIDGSTDNTPDIQTAANYCKDKGLKMMSDGEEFIVSGASLNLRDIALDLNSRLHFKGDTSGYITIGGNSNSGSNPKQYVREVFSDDPRDIQTPLVRIVGAKDQLIEIERCESVMLYAKNNLDLEAGSIAYSTFRLQYVKRIWIFGDPQDGGSTFPGWINENTFYLKRTAEVLMGNGNSASYSHNHNIFHTGTFESSGRKIEIIRGSQNRFYNLRLEAIDPESIIFRPNAEDNKVYVSWSSSQATQPAYKIPYIDEGRNNMVSAEDEGQYNLSPTLILNTDTVVFDDDTTPRWSNIKDIGNWVSVSEDSERKNGTLDVSRSGNRLSVAANKVIARTGRIPVSSTGDTWVSIANGDWSSGGYRALIYGYTRSGNPITPSSGDMYVVGQGGVPFGNVNTTNRTTGDYVQITNSACYYIEVVIANGSVNALFEYINVSVRNPKSPAAISSSPIVQQADWGIVCNVSSGALPLSYGLSEDVDRSSAWSKTLFIPDQSVMTLTFGYSTNTNTGNAYRQSIVNVGNSGSEVYITDIANQDLDGSQLEISYVEVAGGFNIEFTKPTSLTSGSGSVSLVVTNPKGVYEA